MLLGCLIPSAGAMSLNLILGSLILLQFLVGVAHAPVCPATAAGIERWFPVGRRGPLWLQVPKDRNVLLITLSYTCANFVFYVVFSWGYYYLVTVRGFAAQAAGFLTSLQWLGAGVGAIVGGLICDRLCRRIGTRWGYRSTIVVGMVGSAALLLGVAYQPNALAAAMMRGLCFFLNQTSEGPFWAMCTAIGGRHAGACTGLMNTGANLMGFINALLLAAIAERVGGPTAIAVGAAFAVAGAVLILLVRADKTIDQST